MAKQAKRYANSRPTRFDLETDAALIKIAEDEEREPIFFIRKFVKEALKKRGYIKPVKQ